MNQNSDIDNIVNFDPNTTSANSATITNGIGELSSTTTANLYGGYWNYIPYYYSSNFTLTPTIKQAKNGFVVEFGSDIYVAKNLKEVTKILTNIFNPTTKKVVKKRG